MFVELNEEDVLYIRYHMDSLSSEDQARIKVLQAEFKRVQSDGSLNVKLRAASAEFRAAAARKAKTPDNIWDALKGAVGAR